MTPISVTIPNSSSSFKFKLKGFDSAHVERSISGNVVISDYVHAYVVRDTNDGAFYMKPRAAVYPSAPGSSFGLNVTATVNDAAGNLVDTVTFVVTLFGPPLPPNAVTVEISEGPVVQDNFNVPADPGTAVINF